MSTISIKEDSRRHFLHGNKKGQQIGEAGLKLGIIEKISGLFLLLKLSGTMENTLGKKSSILILKSKFFLFRAVIYFSFLLIPIWTPKVLSLSLWQQTILGVLYALFMGGQWFLLGKEIDYRFKIYAKANSSLDRVVYRLFMGMFFLIIYFNLLNFLPAKWIYNLFWVTWALLGFFYSWPTRGKIIQESMSGQFTEFRFLDSFERTILAITIFLFIISIPALPPFESISALKLYYDPHEFIHQQFWNFLDVNYFPFHKYPQLLKVAWWTYFYVVSQALLLLLVYSIARYFVSRRLSLLTVMAFMSSWSIIKLLVEFHGVVFYSLFPLLLLWGYLWSVRSATYRAGLFWGLIGYFGALLNPHYWPLALLSYLMFFMRYLQVKTAWYKRQVLRYMTLGLALAFLVVLTSDISWNHFSLHNVEKLWEVIVEGIDRKGFFVISLFGLLIVLAKFFLKEHLLLLKTFSLGPRRREQLLFFILLIVLLSGWSDVQFYVLPTLFILALLSMVPVELLFQRIYRLRSSRNMIYAIYILLCLLDSHIEGRIKIFFSIFR